tara:strand:+ start:118 stop:453 length:336 start_codon:yes stop_codon:yes gene_type:complete
MQKSLEQIQQENRKFILEAIHGCSYEEALEIEKQEIKSLTLSRVLLAIWKSDKYYNEMWFDQKFHALKFDLKGVSFDLTKETLEEQTEQTQRAINKFFNMATTSVLNKLIF